VIVIVRHGETALNAARVLQPPDELLNERGIGQAKRVAERARSFGASAIVCSHLPRARMTAEAIARATGLPIELEPLLEERNFGALRGRPWDEVGPGILASDFQPPEGESIPTFDARVSRAWQSTVKRRAALPAGSLIVVTHGMVCASITKQFLALPAGQPFPTRWGNTSVTICEPTAPHKVHTLNCVEHLNEAAVRDGRNGG